jgi:hypothetical protein
MRHGDGRDGMVQGKQKEGAAVPVASMEGIKNKLHVDIFGGSEIEQMPNNACVGTFLLDHMSYHQIRP